METKKLLGKTSDIFNSEIQKDENDLANISNNEFSEKIKKRFEEKRSGREKFLGKEQAQELEKRIFLQIIDENWKSHIQYLEQLRQVIGLRSYGQRDPLNEYKKEAFNLFSNLLEKLKLDYITVLMNLRVIEQPKEDMNTKKNVNNLSSPKCLLVVKNKQKISRNERCEATGKKFKNCCGAL